VRTEVVADPLGRPVRARWALLADGETAVVEVAEAAGLSLVAPAERDPYGASSRGVGELIAAAAAAGAATVLVATGGSATTDGGEGAVAAVEQAGVAPRIVVLCDTSVSWEDAPRIYGPQKGADDETVERLERRLDALAARAPRDPRGVPSTGSAGGLSGGLWAWCGAELQAGAGYVLDAVGFDAELAAAGLVVTGEGRLDEQSLLGKLVGTVAARAGARGVPCVALVGSSKLDPERAAAAGIGRVVVAATLADLRAAGRGLSP